MFSRSTTGLIAALSLFCTFHSAPAEVEQPALLDPKALNICNKTEVKVCANSTQPVDAVCKSYADTVSGTDPKCDQANVCSFLTKVNNTEKLVYVSHLTKTPDCEPNSVTYKKCANGLIIYSLYAQH
ncbi:uncharacterized protein LOC103506672 [Diaphorina citri]|jgi:hypothetical protein|uniref:Uncharacterized protein LOC103506671 n=1 Tax=Diaphorina citri TaxID=121845 RepID=A0A1S3CWQ4_DIACI|nr:uncharacterized protein LOC103506671 [Diaphorina citri]XP_008469287.1 uncharacterized protein LOC103506671 [Diaphorina citri]XP_008469288.1 uncharacterized protein LOC103506672 [Diaphorina citri]